MGRGGVHDDGRRTAVGGGLIVALVGLGAALVPVYDAQTDVAAGKPIASTVIENVPLLVIAAIVLASGVWLARSSWGPIEVRTIVTWTVGALAFTATVFSFILGIQVYLQAELKPFVIAADAVLLATLGGLAIGVRSAQEQTAQRRRFEGLFEHVPNPIVETELDDGNAYVKRVNPAFNNQFGYDDDTIVGEPLEEYIVPPGSDVEPLDDPDEDLELPPEDIWTRDVIELETVDGRREFVRLAVPAEADYGDSGYGIYIDVTPQRQRQERLEVLARVLRHDIRNRVNVIDAYAQYLADDGEWDTPPEELEEIQEAASELHALGERTRIAEALAVETASQRVVDLAGTVADVVEQMRANHAATFTTSVPDGAHALATDDLATALEEVVENAVAHTDTADPSIEITVEPTYDGEYYDITVHDDGPGIPRDQFEVVTGERERTQVEHPNGIGLWLAYWICRACGGELDFDVTDTGSAVTLRVPAADTDASDDAYVSTPHPNRRPAR